MTHAATIAGTAMMAATFVRLSGAGETTLTKQQLADMDLSERVALVVESSSCWIKFSDGTSIELSVKEESR